MSIAILYMPRKVGRVMTRFEVHSQGFRVMAYKVCRVMDELEVQGKEPGVAAEMN